MYTLAEISLVRRQEVHLSDHDDFSYHCNFCIICNRSVCVASTKILHFVVENRWTNGMAGGGKYCVFHESDM